MGTNSEALKNIYRKINLLFFIIFVASVIFFMLSSLYEYSKYKYNPEYNEVLKIDEKFNLDNRYHAIYFKQFILSNTVSQLLKHLLFISIVIYIFCYSLIINKSDTMTTDVKNIEFTKVSIHGIYLLIALTFLYLISLEFIIPLLENKLGTMRNNTSRAIIALNKGNELYFNNNYNDALYFYEEYIIIIENDDTIDGRIHEIKNKIEIKAFNDKKNQLKKEQQVYDTTTDYFALAENYFQQKDYYSALYYYTYVAEGNVSDSNDAKQKIQLIKKILTYENNLNIKEPTMESTELNKYLDKGDLEIREIYVLKNKADNYIKNNEYLKAYFIYDDILKLNPNLDEVVNAKNEAYNKLKEIAAEIEDLVIAKNFPGKNNFVFMLSNNRLMYIGLITKGKNKFYLYDIKIYTFDTNYNFKNVIEAPYGETKSMDTFTLYSFSLNNRNNSYMPVITYENSRKEIYPEYMFKLPASLNSLYNFSYDYEKTFYTSLINLSMLYNLINENKNNDFSIGFNKNFIKSAIADKISNILIFLSLNLIIMAFSWRLRSSYLTGIPKIHWMVILAVPFFIYIFVNALQKYITLFYSTLAFSTNFILLLVICFVINIIIILFSIFYITSTK